MKLEVNIKNIRSRKNTFTSGVRSIRPFSIFRCLLNFIRIPSRRKYIDQIGSAPLHIVYEAIYLTYQIVISYISGYRYRQPCQRCEEGFPDTPCKVTGIYRSQGKRLLLNHLE